MHYSQRYTYTTANPTDLPHNPTALVCYHVVQKYRTKIEVFIRSLKAIKTVNEHWTKFFLRAYWQRATNNPDLIYLAPCMMAMGLILPWVFRRLAAVVMPSHIDHRKTLSLFPSLALDTRNMQITCSDCNTSKSNKN